MLLILIRYLGLINKQSRYIINSGMYGGFDYDPKLSNLVIR